MKKYLALALIAPLLISCSTTKKAIPITKLRVKDTNGFDILMGQFAHNIENIWGFKEVVIAGPKDYVKYTDQYQTRSHINFDDGTITIETIAGTEPAAHLRRAIIKTLLMGTIRVRSISIPTLMILRFRKNLSFTVRWWTTPGSRFAGKVARATSRIIC